MTSCHPNKPQSTKSDPSCASHAARFRIDWLLWVSLTLVAIAYVAHWFFGEEPTTINGFNVLAHTVFELVNTMWWGVALGMITIAIIGRVPREFVISILGSDRGLRGIVRATMAGVLLDLCSHGILMVGARLYERGATTGQVVAFLLASPWNSLSLTLVLFALIGVTWTLLFIVFSMLVAISVGWLFDAMSQRGVIAKNQHRFELPDDFNFRRSARQKWQSLTITPRWLMATLADGIKASRMVLRWLLFGILLAAIIRALMDTDQFAAYFGPTLAGLGLTLLATTVIEVCSEGSAPIAADLLNRAQAPGNSFAFLMAGVATDYTEIMVLKDVTRSWKTALLLPAVTVPQVIIIAWLMNGFAG
ncbi:MAG: ATPase [Gammaproteobacteria bacterium]|nr:ATPase [Gammaproteobacteria bacterium]